MLEDVGQVKIAAASFEVGAEVRPNHRIDHLLRSSAWCHQRSRLLKKILFTLAKGLSAAFVFDLPGPQPSRRAKSAIASSRFSWRLNVHNVGTSGRLGVMVSVSRVRSREPGAEDVRLEAERRENSRGNNGPFSRHCPSN